MIWAGERESVKQREVVKWKFSSANWNPARLIAHPWTFVLDSISVHNLVSVSLADQTHISSSKCTQHYYFRTEHNESWKGTHTANNQSECWYKRSSSAVSMPPTPHLSEQKAEFSSNNSTRNSRLGANYWGRGGGGAGFMSYINTYKFSFETHMYIREQTSRLFKRDFGSDWHYWQLAFPNS